MLVKKFCGKYDNLGMVTFCCTADPSELLQHYYEFVLL